MKLTLLLYCLLFSATQMLYSAEDTLKTFNPDGGLFFYSDSRIVMQVARFETVAPGYLKQVTILLGGGASTGTATVHLFGYEGGMSAPQIGDELVRPITVRKTKRGVEEITINLDPPVHIEAEQFFVGIDGLSKGVTLLSDRIERKARCISSTDRYYYQFFKTRAGRWDAGKYTYAISAIIDYPNITPAYHLIDVTAESRIDDSLRHNRGIAWSDVDRNGTLDLLMDGRLYRNTGTRTFVDVTRDAGLPAVSQGSGFIDVDRDGDVDLFSVNSPDSLRTRIAFFRNDGSVLFAPAYSVEIAAGSPSTFSVADVNLDGYLDLFIGQENSPAGALNLLVNDRGRGFEIVSLSPATGTRDIRSSQWIDADADGAVDLAVIDGAGVVSLWKNDGAGALREQGVASKTTGANIPSAGYTNVDVADHDINGVPELLLTWQPGRGDSVLRSRSSNIVLETTHEVSTGSAAAPRGTLYQAKQGASVWGDVNNDGYLDLVSTSSCHCHGAHLYTQTSGKDFAAGTFDHGLFNTPAGNDAVWVDYDNDGHLDLATIVDGRFRLYRNRGSSPTNNFLELDFSDASASVGASVVVYSGSRVFTRTVSSGRGRLMQEPLRVHVGVGDAAAIDSVVVQWPGTGKIRDVYHDVAINTINRIAPGSPGSNRHLTTALQVTPNPVTRHTTITYQIESATRVTLEIFSSTGARITTLIERDHAPGTYQTTWSTTDTRGHDLPQGEYTLLMTAGRQTERQKLILVR